MYFTPRISVFFELQDPTSHDLSAWLQRASWARPPHRPPKEGGKAREGTAASAMSEGNPGQNAFAGSLIHESKNYRISQMKIQHRPHFQWAKRPIC
jgi:hypothetical protein